LPRETLIVRLKEDRPAWGAPKIRERLRRLYPESIAPPSAPSTQSSTAMGWSSAVKDDATDPPERRSRPQVNLMRFGAPTTKASSCSPTGAIATITDFASRYLIACEALATTKEAYAFTVFERAFKEFGLPAAIRSDNGVPFASPNALFNLSRLSVWWLRLGIAIERIKPGHPQQNGRHERMHLTLKLETTRPAGRNFLQQQARFDDFIDSYNTERPHQALAMQCPGQLYHPSRRPYRGLPELDYPFHDKAVVVTNCGRIAFKPARST